MRRNFARCMIAVITIISLFATVAAFSDATIDTVDTADYIRFHTFPPDSYAKKASGKTLAYITPWNTKAFDHIETYGDKIDLVSPVWYTILVSPSTNKGTGKEGEKAKYELSGGPDKDWLKKVQAGTKHFDIVPRFYLDKWQQNDYTNLLANKRNWDRLAKLIATEVEKHDYDGIVLETAASHLLFEPIQAISKALKALKGGKTLTVVLQPLRTKYSSGGEKIDAMQNSLNKMIVQSIPQLAQLVDYFSIMTYDMSGAGGRVSPVSGKDFPKDSPLRGAKKGSLRQPGPNTSPKWIKENLEMIEEATKKAFAAKQARTRKQKEDKLQKEYVEVSDEERMKDPSNPFLYSDFSADEVLDENEVSKEDDEDEEAEDTDELAAIRGKLLMGMPMYGYRYPLFFIDKATGQGIPVPPPADADQAQQLFARSQPSSEAASIPFLRGAGEALTMEMIISVLIDNDGVIVDPRDGQGEGWFDWVETITAKHLQGNQGLGLREGDQIYWRLYLPLPDSTTDRLSAVERDPGLGAGVSLWELGQANAMLLNDL